MLTRRRGAPPVPAMTPLVLPDGGAPLRPGPELFQPRPLAGPTEVMLPTVRIVIRPVEPSDARTVADLVQQLSPTTAYRRFHAPVRTLTTAQLAGLVDVDHRERETLLALLPGRRPAAIAMAQYVRVDEDEADLAVVVADGWQRHGVGRALVARLGEAALAVGISRFSATVLADNPGPSELARSVAPGVESVGQGSTRDLRIPLTVGA